MRWLSLLAALLIGSAHAQTPPATPPAAAPTPPPATVPEPPPLPDNYTPPPPPPEPSSSVPDVEAAPEITIITKGTEIHEEYRVNGRLYMIKVSPKHGKPYYLIDKEGSGQFRRSDQEPSISIPMWVIKSW